MTQDYSKIQHPIPRGEIPFQDVCLKLARNYWEDDLAEAFGRSGQRQHGVDILGNDKRHNRRNAAMQCKGSVSHEPRKLTPAEIRDEVEKAKKLELKLGVLIIAYAGKRDAKLQALTKTLSDQNEDEGLFPVALWDWDTIVSRAEEFPEVQQAILVLNSVPVIASDHLNPTRRSASPPGASTRVDVAMTELQAAVRALQGKDDVGDPVLQAKLDVWKGLVESGDGRLAIEGLRAFIAGLPADSTSRARYRANVNLGAALATERNYAAAALAFDAAAAAEGDTADGHATAARAALMREDAQEAYREASLALTLDPKHHLAAAILVDMAPHGVSAADLEVKVSQTASHSDVGMALSRRFSLEHRHEDMLRVARGIQETKPAWARPVAIGEAILFRFDRDYGARLGAPLSNEAKALLAEAQGCLEKGWAELKSRADASNWVHVPANLASVYKLIGREDLADPIVMEAYQLRPDDDGIKAKAIFAFVHQGDLDTAARLADELAEAGDPDNLFVAANVAAWRKEWQRVEHWAQKAYDNATDGTQKALAADLLVLAMHRGKSGADALDLADKLRATFPASIAFERRVADIARRQGDEARLDAAQKILLAFDQSKLDAMQRFELADALTDQGEFGKAADLWAGLHTKDRATEPLTRHLFALLRADRRGDARALFDSLKGDALKSKEVLRLGAAIYERSGLLPKAIQLLDSALKIDPNDLDSRLDWVRLSLRENRVDTVQKWARSAPENFEGPADDLMELAQVLDQYGDRKRALGLGYRVLRSNWTHSEAVHLKYMSLFLQHPEIEPFLEPGSITEDSVVYLADRRGQKRRYLISRAEPSAETLSPENEFARKLFGLKVGDQVTLTPAYGDSIEWTVKEIKHKYVDLFHTVMAEHSTLFAGSRAFGQFEIDATKDSGFEPIFDQVRKRAEYVSDVTALYERNLTTIDAVGKLIGLDAIDASLGLRFTMNKVLDNWNGTHEERVRALKSLVNVKRILVDPLTLGIWKDIGVLDIVEKLNSIEICVVQSARDLFRARADAATAAIEQDGGSMQAEGDQIVVTKQTKADRESVAAKAVALETWVRAHTTIVPTETLAHSSAKDLSKIMSRASIDTIATAAGGGLFLMSEDHRLRSLAREIGVTSSGWTQALLMRLTETEQISPLQYVQAIAKIKDQRVGFVAVASLDLLTAAKHGLEREWGVLCDALCGPTVDLQNTLHIANSVICQLWTDEAYTEVRARLTGQLLSALIKRPGGKDVVGIIAESTHRDLGRQPFPLSRLADTWRSYIERFATGHFLRESILG